jgi:hypothetical protein
LALTVAALPTRILWLLRDRTDGAYADEIAKHFAAYHVATLCGALKTLTSHRLITQPTAAGPYVITAAGQAAANNPTPPRWSARRPTPPRTATISR